MSALSSSANTITKIYLHILICMYVCPLLCILMNMEVTIECFDVCMYTHMLKVYIYMNVYRYI